MTTTAEERPPYLWALATFVLVLFLYVLTLAPTTAFWDASEYIAAARVIGIPHPPGNPLFVILAHTFGLLPLGESYAARINLFAATTSAGAAAFWFLVAERWLRSIVPVRWARYGAAMGGALVGATSWTVWNQSVVNEKVYTVSLLSIAVVLWLVVRWGDDEPGPHRDRWLVLIAYVLALTATNHLMGFLALPALGIYVLWTDWRVAIQPWAVVTFYALLLAVSGAWLDMFKGDTATGPLLIVLTLAVLGYALWRSPKDALVYLGILAVVVGISLNYLWLPLRAAQYPAVNEGEPVGLFSQALQDVLNRVQYGKPPLMDRQAPFTAQLANFWQYFTWQYARGWGRFAGIATALFAVLGLSGLWTLWKTDRRAGLAAAALLGVLTVGLVYYMNFKYGFSIYPDEASLSREVRERDYFFLGSFSAYGVFVALGLGSLMRGIADFLSERAAPGQRWGIASAALALAFVPLVANGATAGRSGETMARDFAHDILQSVEPYGILITAGDNDTFPLWYAQEVEGIRRDVTLANLSLMNTEWHLRQLKRRADPGVRPGGVGAAVAAVEGAGTSQGSRPEHSAQGDRQPAGGDASAARGRRRVRQPAHPVRPGCPAAPGSGHDLPDPGQPGEAPRLFQLERRGLSGPDLRAERVPDLAGVRAEADALAGHTERLDRPEPGARLRRFATHAGAPVGRLPLADGDPRAPGWMGRSAVGLDPAAVFGDLRRRVGNAEEGRRQHRGGSGGFGGSRGQ